MARSKKIQKFAQVDPDVPRAFHLGALLFNDQLQFPPDCVKSLWLQLESKLINFKYEILPFWADFCLKLKAHLGIEKIVNRLLSKNETTVALKQYGS